MIAACAAGRCSLIEYCCNFKLPVLRCNWCNPQMALCLIVQLLHVEIPSYQCCALSECHSVVRFPNPQMIILHSSNVAFCIPTMIRRCAKCQALYSTCFQSKTPHSPRVASRIIHLSSRAKQTNANQCKPYSLPFLHCPTYYLHLYIFISSPIHAKQTIHIGLVRTPTAATEES